MPGPAPGTGYTRGQSLCPQRGPAHWGQKPRTVSSNRGEFTYGDTELFGELELKGGGSHVLVTCFFPFKKWHLKKKKILNCGLSNGHIEFQPGCADLPEVVSKPALLEKF